MRNDAQDAARYRYLRDFAVSRDLTMDGTARWWLVLPAWAMPRARSLDEAIDAGRRDESETVTPEGTTP